MLSRQYLELLFILLILIGIYLYLTRFFWVGYAFGISECASFPNNTLNYLTCKIAPGSIILLVKKSSPLFGIYSNEWLIPLIVIGFILIALGTYIIVRGVYLLLKGRYLLSSIFIILSAIFFAGGILFIGSPITKDVVLCYKSSYGFIICHSLERVEGNKFILKPSRYNVTEVVTWDQIYGRVVLSIPDIGGMIYSIKVGFKVAKELYDIIKQGEIPRKIYIESISEP